MGSGEIFQLSVSSNQWGSGEVGKLSHHPITLSPYHPITLSPYHPISS
ncbi:hypothetical protein RVR34_24190 [Microcystis aeruginosa FBCC-A68]|nr:hypothetical protein [Microcystis aeruginosa]